MARDRGQSVSVNYTLSLIIVTVLISALFISMSGFLDDERERVVSAELKVLGNRMAADIATADRLARTTSSPARVEVRTDIPTTVGGSDYRVDVSATEFQSSGTWNVTITLRAPDVQVSQTVNVRTETRLVDSEFGSGAYVVVYDGSTMEVTRA
jgi:hypothetical protein